MKKIIIVNEKDIQIDLKDEKDMTNKDIFRSSALWLINNKKDILLSRRSLKKYKDPRMWGPAVAGTIEEQETYEDNIIKESKEELGLKNIKPKKIFKSRIKFPYNHFTQWFLLTLNQKDFNFNDEVEETKWFSKQELKKAIKSNPDNFVKSMREEVNKLINIT